MSSSVRTITGILLLIVFAGMPPGGALAGASTGDPANRCPAGTVCERALRFIPRVGPFPLANPAAPRSRSVLDLFVQTYPDQAHLQDRAPGRAAKPVHSIVLTPSDAYQSRGFLVPASKDECQALATAHPQFATRSCYLHVTVDLRSRNAHPIQTGSPLLIGRGVQTAYTSMTVCLSGPTMAGHGDCYGTVQNCRVSSSSHLPNCYPAWDDRISAQFQYNGKVARRIWFDPSLITGYGFTVRLSVPPYPRTSVGTTPLAIGETLRVAGSMPVTHQVRVQHTVRIMVSARGRVRYSVW